MTRSLAPPRASAMLEALRGMGYSVAAALADIIDNSISAGAKNVRLDFIWNGANSAIRIIDDGHGMNEQQLHAAMTLGSSNPLDQRATTDLGRFGMGLKTASLSQCRRLTVVSQQNGIAVTRRWDLDYIAASPDNDWHLLHEPVESALSLCAPIGKQNSGTLVLWECLDRIITPGFGEKNLFDLIDRVEQHLSMVFHHFLEKPNPALRIFINGDAEYQQIKPWDPFLSKHPATYSSPVQQLKCANGRIRVQGFVLPHRDRLSKDEADLAAGPEGWTAQQGFYVYRNNRLLVAGGWLGLGRDRAWTREEAHKLARIRVDLPNTVDEDWKIDIRKSSARPPVALRPRLTDLADKVRFEARRVFAHRGQYGSSGTVKDLAQAWKVSELAKGPRYRIDTTHPTVRAVLDQAGNLAPTILAMLRVIEETVPVQRIWLDTVEQGDVPQGDTGAEPSEDMREMILDSYADLIGRVGMMPAVARQNIARTTPFHKYASFIAALPDDPTDRK